MKKVTFTGKPASRSGATSPDQWVSDRVANSEPTKRLTFDVPLSMHQRIKVQCAQEGKLMADVLREILEQHFGESAISGSDHDTHLR